MAPETKPKIWKCKMEWNEYTRNAKEHQQNTYRGYGGHTAADEQEQRGDEKEERIDQAKSKFREQPVEMIQSLDNVKRVGDEKGDTDPEGAHRRESIESGRAGGRRELRHNEAGQVDNLNKTMIVRRAFSGVAKDARATHNDDNLDKTSCRVDIVIIVSYQRSDVGGGCRLKVCHVAQLFWVMFEVKTTTTISSRRWEPMQVLCQ